LTPRLLRTIRHLPNRTAAELADAIGAESRDQRTAVSTCLRRLAESGQVTRTGEPARYVAVAS